MYILLLTVGDPSMKSRIIFKCLVMTFETFPLCKQHTWLLYTLSSQSLVSRYYRLSRCPCILYSIDPQFTLRIEETR